MGLKKDFRKLLHPYYWLNILVTLSYIAAKKIEPICRVLFPTKTECELDMRESEILFFLLIIIVFRSRKTGSVTMVNYLSSSFIYTKAANLMLWCYADIRYGLIFAAIFVLMGLLMPEPVYSGPENITYFRASGLDEELERDKRVIWIVCFYTAWNPACVNFAPVFSELSSQYSLDNLKFGKVDIGRYPDAGIKHRVNDSPLSRQLPTVLLFKEGKESIRKPEIDSSSRVQKFFFSEDNVKASLDLNNLYYECKRNPLKVSKKHRHDKEE